MNTPRRLCATLALASVTAACSSPQTTDATSSEAPTTPAPVEATASGAMDTAADEARAALEGAAVDGSNEGAAVVEQLEEASDTVAGEIAAAVEATSTAGTSPNDWPTSGPAPTPYTAEEIREGNPDGTLTRYVVTQAGQQPLRQVFAFEGGDADGVTVVAWIESVDGEALGAQARQRAGWSELRDHARFDAAHTVRTEVERTVPAGTFACWLYTVTSPDDATTVQRFYFAKDKPGSPILHQMDVAGQRVYEMELIELQRG